MAMFIVKPWYRKKDDAIYGAEWAGTSDPSWVRTDAAVGFSAPNPYYSGMSTTPSSPFDNIMPWSGMRRVTDASAGELVEIPKFYYKWTRGVAKMKLQISMTKFDGFLTSPAHADRGDGVGERDYVYIGRYHCASDYKSKTGVTPKTNITRATARSNIHNLGGNIWQEDFAMWWTIRQLYLVEYADWNSQAKIGFGGNTGSSANSTGGSDNMPYHTGTMKSARSTSGNGIQYRYIEDMWANIRDWCDGIYFNNANIYAIKSPADFSDTSNGTLIGQRATSSGISSGFTSPTAGGFEYALYPNAVGGSDTAYITDNCYYGSTGTVLSFGGSFSPSGAMGAFCLVGDDVASYYYINIGSRLMVLPPSRLSA